jgi:hypothetical protein
VERLFEAAKAEAWSVEKVRCAVCVCVCALWDVLGCVFDACVCVCTAIG